MIYDPTPRWKKSLDALSQWANVTFFPKHFETTSDESISGRAHRMNWPIERWIDLLFSPFEQDHCRLSYEADLERAQNLLTSHENQKSQ